MRARSRRFWEPRRCQLAWKTVAWQGGKSCNVPVGLVIRVAWYRISEKEGGKPDGERVSSQLKGRTDPRAKRSMIDCRLKKLGEKKKRSKEKWLAKSVSLSIKKGGT